MTIVIEPSLLKVYFELLIPSTKSKNELLLISAIDSQLNKIKVSENLLDIYEQYFKEPQNQNFYQFYLQFISNFSLRLTIAKTTKLTNLEDELISCYQFDTSHYTFILTNDLRTKISSTLPEVSCSYNQVKDFNKDSIILYLSSRNILSINNKSFTSKEKLYTFFEHIVKLNKDINLLHIQDTYFNLHLDSVCSVFKGSFDKIRCYTRIDRNEESSIKRNRIKTYFGKRKTNVSFSKDRKILHPRRILINNLLIDFTHDFSEIQMNNSNWNVYLAVCDDKKQEFLNTAKNYN